MKNLAVHNMEIPGNGELQQLHKDTSLAERDIALIRDVPVRIVAELGSATLTIEKLFALKRGDVVELDQGLDEIITFYMKDKPVARGNLVAVGDQYGIELTEIL